MPPQPTYRPEFSRAEIDKARGIFRRRTCSHGQARRARLAVLLHEEPELSNTELAQRLGVHRNTVWYWCKRWEQEGFDLEDKPRSGRPRFFPPSDYHHRVKSIACEVPAKRGQPLSRLFVPDIHRILIAEKHVDSISLKTIWRILDADALKPWRHRSWIWFRDPLFTERANKVLDLYSRQWNKRPLRDDEFVISADEKTNIQARIRIHDRQIRANGRGQHVEHEYERGGAWAYLAALDVHRATVYGRVEKTNGIEPFHRLVEQVMTREPYKSARRVFWIVDQGSSHRPTTFPGRLRSQFRNAHGISLPVHASWLNQIEIYFSILQRKALTPNDFATLDDVRNRIHRFAKRFNARGEPFDWRFTRHDLRRRLDEYADRVVTADAAEEYRDTG